MKIVSRFKDYYDYVSHTLGQDEDVVYLRGKIPEDRRELLANKKLTLFPRKATGDVESEVEYIVAGEFFFPILCQTMRMAL